MKNIWNLICGLLIAVACFAGQKPKPTPPPERPPTEAEMRTAYDLSVKQIMALAVNPESIRISIDKAWFSMNGQVKGQDTMKMYVVFQWAEWFWCDRSPDRHLLYQHRQRALDVPQPDNGRPCGAWDDTQEHGSGGARIRKEMSG